MRTKATEVGDLKCARCGGAVNWNRQHVCQLASFDDPTKRPTDPTREQILALCDEMRRARSARTRAMMEPLSPPFVFRVAELDDILVESEEE